MCKCEARPCSFLLTNSNVLGISYPAKYFSLNSPLTTISYLPQLEIFAKQPAVSVDTIKHCAN